MGPDATAIALRLELISDDGVFDNVPCASLNSGQHHALVASGCIADRRFPAAAPAGVRPEDRSNEPRTNHAIVIGFRRF